MSSPHHLHINPLSATVCRFVLFRQYSADCFSKQTFGRPSYRRLSSLGYLCFACKSREKNDLVQYHQPLLELGADRGFVSGSAEVGAQALRLVRRSATFGSCRSVHGRMDEADSATKALGLDEPPIVEPSVDGVGSDTESEAEVASMAVMAEPGNIDIGAESLPNPDEAEAAFAGKAGFSSSCGRRPLLRRWR